MRDGVSPNMPMSLVKEILESYKYDPPTRYRTEYWLRLIAEMIFGALGGKGEVPLPPWLKDTKARDNVDTSALISSLRSLGGVVDAERNTVEFKSG